MLIEFEVVADDRANRRAHRLGAVAFRQMRGKALLGLRRLHEQDARGRLVRACRPHLHDVDKLPKQLVGNGLILPLIVGAGFEENLIQAFRQRSARP